jgi:hypothetical protein
MRASTTVALLTALAGALAVTVMPLSGRAAARQTPPGAAGAGETVAIVDARILPVSGPPVERGTIVVNDGRIGAVGANVKPPAGARIVAGDGRIVTPGWFDSANADRGRRNPAVGVGHGRRADDRRARERRIHGSGRVQRPLRR